MGETVEKRLKDYKGFEVWKVTDNKATSKEEVTYMLNDSEGNNINCFKTLNELKQFADNYKWKWHFKEVLNMSIYKVYCRSKAHKQWKPYSQPFINKENAEKCKVKCESRRICDIHGNLIEYKVMEEKQ